MKTVVNAILILLVCLGCIAGGLAVGEKKWKDASQKVSKRAYNAVARS